MSKLTNTFFEFNSRLDRDFLHSLYEDDISYAVDVFESFLNDTKNEFREIKKKYKENDIRGIRQKLHKIKPTFSFVGLTELTKETEQVIKICDLSSCVTETEPGCSDLFSKISDSFCIVEEELSRMKNFLQ
jgi:hypothetical protein